MDYALQARIEPGYIAFLVTGTNSVETVRSYLRDIADRCERDGNRYVLIEESLAGPRLYSADVMNLMLELAPRAARLFDRLAYVDLQAGLATPGMEFAGSVAINLGASVRVFADPAAARRWLLDTADADPGA